MSYQVIKTWDGSKSSSDTTLVSAGEYKIMASMLQTGASSSISEFGPYSIFVDYSFNNPGNSTTTSTTTSPTATTTSATTTTQTSTSTNIQTNTRTIIKYVSVHSNPEELSDYSGVTKFEISAGRERIGYIGTPNKFSAKSNSYKNNNCLYSWTFGDGSKEIGENTSHVYKFPGEYNIILNAFCGDESSVSRTKIKILKPEISAVFISAGDLEVINLGNTEINLGGWSVMGSSSKFIIPEDTIISAKSSIFLPKDYSKLALSNNEAINFLDPSNKTIISLANNSFETNNISVENNQKILSVNTTKEEVENFKTAFLQNIKNENNSYAYANNVVMKAGIDQNPNNTSSSTNNIKTATVLESVNTKETKGFWKNFFGLPSRGIKAITRVFYDVD